MRSDSARTLAGSQRPVNRMVSRPVGCSNPAPNDRARAHAVEPPAPCRLDTGVAAAAGRCDRAQ